MREGDYSLDTYFLKNKADGAGAQVISRWSYQTRITPAVVVWIHFQILDLAGERWLSHTEPLGRTSEMLLLSNYYEISQMS